MSREIKFRAWDKRHNSMEICQDLYWFEENYVRQTSDTDSMTGDWEVMQYTGLKDTNGVEIYEGDICRTTNGDVRVVVYLAPVFGLATSISEQYDVEDFTTPMAHEEVIGNIYENPELLTPLTPNT